MNYLVKLKTGRGKQIASEIVPADRVKETLDGYAEKLETGFLSRGYFGKLYFDNNINPAGLKYRLEWTFKQACTLFQDKEFIITAVPV